MSCVLPVCGGPGHSPFPGVLAYFTHGHGPSGKGHVRMAFNVRVIDYPAGKQVRVYDRAVDVPVEGMEETADDGMEYCPFTGKKEKVEDADMRERSMRVSMSRTVNRLYYLARSNRWDWFVTLTFAPDKVDRSDYGACVKLLSKWLNNCRRKVPEMKYIVVPEQHKSGAWPFHGLFSQIGRASCRDRVYVLV